MTEEQKEILKKKIIKGNELYSLQGSRMRRLLKNPIRTIPYYIVNIISKIRPFKIGYTTLWGDRMCFFLPEGGAILYYGFFEPNLTIFFINFLKKGDVFFDVGAHVGYYSLLASNLVEQEGYVHSFEPTPRTFQTLKENAGPKTNITVNNRAVMATETEIEFTDYGPRYSAFNSFQKRTGEEMSILPTPERIQVKTVSLDHYCSEKNITPTLIKIDAEGAEHIILQAMENILTRKKSIVTIEVAGGEEWGENCHKSISFLQQKGYLGFEINLNGHLTPHVERTTYVYDNLVFVHKDNLRMIEHLVVK